MLPCMKSLVASSLVCAAVVGSVSLSNAADMPKSAVYFSVGTTVTNQERFTGRLAVEGHPVLLVRADLQDTPWWVQEPVEMLSPKLFRGKGRFGNAKTRPRTRFFLVALVLPSKEAAEEYKVGQQVKSLPVDVPRSAIVPLSLIRSDAPTDKTSVVDAARPDLPVAKAPATAAVGTPTKEATTTGEGKVKLTHSIPKNVDRLQELKFKSDRSETPRVLVRAMGKGNPWWVQRVPEKGDGNSYSVKAIFGNDRTPNGHQFQVVVVFPAAGIELPPGVSIKTLSADWKQSPVITVERGSAPAQTAANERE